MCAFPRWPWRVGFVVESVIAIAVWGIGPASAVSHSSATFKPAITSGRLHSCALSTAGTVVCWGDNSYGELGNNSIVQSSVPVQVHGVGNVGFLSSVKAITAGNGFACALLATKMVDCWGYGGDGELGAHSTARALVPVKVHGVGNVGLLSGVTAITAGSGFACALLTTKTVDCWGSGTNGELGTHSTTRSLAPVAVHGVGNDGVLSGVTAISAGGGHTPCALLVAKTMVCWGSGTNGELGNNSNAGSLVPVKVHGAGDVGFLGGVTAITGAGSDSSCALLTDKTVDCWGYDASLGIDSSPGDSLTPVPVHGVANIGFLSGVTAIVDHSDTPCVLLGVGNVDCWGQGVNRLGNSYGGPGLVPVQVHAVDDVGILSGVTAISGGEASSCALSNNGAVVCWGDNGYGELGDNTFNASARPVPVSGVNGVGFLSL